MKNILKTLSLLAALFAAGSALATPPPVLGPDKDADGKPLPFGRAPHLPDNTPLGSGPFKAIMAEDPSLPDHTLYYPANMDAAGKLPVITWGNGACINAGNRFRILLTELASHGFLVVAGGPIDNPKYEVGPQENPAVPAPGAPRAAPPPAPANPPPPQPGDATGRNTAPQMIAALDWAQKANEDPSSKFYHKLNVDEMGVAGQSCGGGLAITVSADPRIKASVIYSGAGGPPPSAAATANGAAPNANARLDAIHAPVLILSGDAQHDIAHQGSVNAAAYITKVPVFGAWQQGLSHIGTYGMVNGGELGRLGWQWLAWQLRGDQQAAKTFKGADCGLCTEGDGWNITRHLN